MESSGGGLGKLLSKSLNPKRRRMNQQSDGSSDEFGPRERNSVASLATLESDGTNSSLPRADEEGSLLISFEESEPSKPLSAPARPTAIASTHPSQIGYLTTSSPLIQEEHRLESRDPQPGHSPRATTFPPQPQRTSSQESVPSLQSSKTGLTLPKSNQTTRSASPGARFREVFRSKKSSTESLNSSPERKPSPALTNLSEEAAGAPGKSIAAQGGASQTTELSDAPKKPASTERFRRLSKGQKIDTSNPPQTPPSAEKATPVIVNTPPTPTDHHRPTIPSLPLERDQARYPAPVAAGNAAAGSKWKEPPPQLGNMISERRARSGSGNLGPSKLSNTVLAPLSPTPEGAPPSTPSAASFFSSMFSAAQNAANTLSNTIQNTNIGPVAGNNRVRSASTREGSESSGQTISDDRVGFEPFPGSTSKAMGSKEPAVRTLGMGDLSLSHLGIVEPANNSAAPSSASKGSEFGDARSRSESAPVESQSTTFVGGSDYHQDESPPLGQTGRESAGSGDQTTPAGSVYEDKNGLQRNGSIRSAIGRHRKRGSSAATGGTGNTIAAAISAANASVAHPSALGSSTKLTGFAVASKKRNQDFHGFFKSVPDDDYLIEDYSCALQRDILVHGRLYVSEGHLCFSSNIFGWITTLVMSFDEIVSVEKRNTALVFKNGLMISTLHAKHVFASFTSRDSTYDLIVKIWKLGHPSLQSSLNGVRLEETGGDKTEKVAEAEPESAAVSQSGSGSEDESGDDEDEDEDVYDEDEEDGGDGPNTSQLTESKNAEAEADKTAAQRKASGSLAATGTASAQHKDAPNSGSGAGGASGGGGGGSGGGDDFPGPVAHSPTECGDSDTHYDKIVGDDIIAAPLGKVYNLVFGPASPVWVSKFLTVDQKCFDLQMEDQKGLGPDNKTRGFSYTKPLNASIGPRQTKCIISEHLDAMDLEKAVSVTCTTQTPDVPSGNVFSVKTKYCLSWAENNSTRLQVNCTIEWTGKSWLKGPIEKGANDGQSQYVKDLMAGIRAAVTARARAGTTTPGGAAMKGKKKGRKGKAAPTSAPTSDGEGASPKAVAKSQDWGILEPLHGVLGPFVDIIKPLMTGNVVYGLLVGLLVASWFGFGFVNNSNRLSSRGYGSGRGGSDYGYPHPQYHQPDRLAAYEEMWRREESELWEWLEDRVGLQRLYQSGGAGDADRTPPASKKVGFAPRTAEEKLRESRAEDRDIREAIRITEEKLKALKASIEKKGSAA